MLGPGRIAERLGEPAHHQDRRRVVDHPLDDHERIRLGPAAPSVDQLEPADLVTEGYAVQGDGLGARLDSQQVGDQYRPGNQNLLRAAHPQSLKRSRRPVKDNTVTIAAAYAGPDRFAESTASRFPALAPVRRASPRPSTRSPDAANPGRYRRPGPGRRRVRRRGDGECPGPARQRCGRRRTQCRDRCCGGRSGGSERGRSGVPGPSAHRAAGGGSRSVWPVTAMLR